MPQIPEALIQALMQMTGGKREDIENNIRNFLDPELSLDVVERYNRQ